jgi:hypothetical protein
MNPLAISTSPLETMQATIANLYETPVNFSVEDFLITDLKSIGVTPDANRVQTDEMLFVLETQDDIDISLFLNATVVEMISQRDPHEPLGFDSLQHYLLALEGVSHFQYVVWNAERKKSITLFELELQAEVDKYILVSMALANQRNGKLPKDLYGYLFDTVQYRQELTPILTHRYGEANHYAGKYCRSLKSEFPEQHQQQDFLTEVRRFYRLTQNEKVRRIENSG